MFRIRETFFRRRRRGGGQVRGRHAYRDLIGRGGIATGGVTTRARDILVDPRSRNRAPCALSSRDSAAGCASRLRRPGSPRLLLAARAIVPQISSGQRGIFQSLRRDRHYAAAASLPLRAARPVKLNCARNLLRRRRSKSRENLP